MWTARRNWTWFEPSLSDCKRVLTPRGKYVFIGHDHFGAATGRWLGSVPRALKLMALSLFVSELRSMRVSGAVRDRLVVLRELMEAGKITPVMDRTYPLSEVPDAIRYLAQGHARGKIVITV